MHTKAMRASAVAMTLIVLAAFVAFSAPNLTTQTLGGFSNGNGASGNGGTQMTSGILGQWVQGTSTGGASSVTSGFLPTSSSNPLAVTLGYFHAVRADGMVQFTWQTATESGVAGFELYAETAGERTLLTPAMVPSTVIDAVTPTTYGFSVETQATIFYLNEVGVDGGSTLHGPFEEGAVYGEYAQPNNAGTEPSIYLPLVTNQ